MTEARQTWHAEHSIETAAPKEIVWSLFRDVSAWREWNAGVERIELEGEFATGTWFWMKTPGQEAFRSRLIDVRENDRFSDRTEVGDLVVTVVHRLERLATGSTRITYAIDAEGPEAEQIGPHIAADFPDVLTALAARAQAAQS